MIEIKFRAYNTIVNRFQFFDLIEVEQQKGDINWPVLKIDQYTEMIDKDSNEIYNGDIVRLVGGTCDSFISISGDKHKRGTVFVVRKMNSGFMLVLPRHRKESTPNITTNVRQYDFWNHQRSLKVIGNVHKNKNLLNV